jgi:hypothetical protein
LASRLPGTYTGGRFAARAVDSSFILLMTIRTGSPHHQVRLDLIRVNLTIPKENPMGGRATNAKKLRCTALSARQLVALGATLVGMRSLDCRVDAFSAAGRSNLSAASQWRPLK